MTPEIFLKIIHGKLIAWDYVQHAQYEIDLPHLERIMQLCSGAEMTESALDQALKSCGILNTPEPDAWGWDCLSRIFHVGTQIGLKAGEALPTDDYSEEYINYCQSIVDDIPSLHLELPGPVIDLPPPHLASLHEVKLMDALLARQTHRAFTPQSIDLTQVGTALWATFGAVHGNSRQDLEEQGLIPVGYRRTSPSGGSLQPSEPYLVAMRINGLPAGIYHYRSHTHQLSVVQDGFDSARLGPLLGRQNFANDLAYGVFITSRFDRVWWKYPHSRVYRATLIDIGCLLQTFQLVCTAQNLQSWPSGHFIDDEINTLLRVDTARESAMFFVGAGYGSGVIAREARSIIQSASKRESSHFASKT